MELRGVWHHDGINDGRHTERDFDKQTAALKQIFNVGGTFALNGIVAGSGDIVINAPVSPGGGVNVNSTYLNFTNSGNVYMNVDSSIVAGGNVSGGVWPAGSSTVTRDVTYFEGLGNVYIGNIGTVYRGNFVLDGDASTGGVTGMNTILTHSNSLGTTTGNVNIGYAPSSGGNGTLQLGMLVGGNPIPDITVTRGAFNYAPRAGMFADDPHVLNASGNNTIVTADTNTLTGNTGGNWNIQSDAGKLTIRGATATTGPIYNTAPIPVNMVLSARQWPNRFTTRSMAHRQPGTRRRQKRDRYLDADNIPLANGTTFLAVPTASKTSIFTGTLTAMQGTLALSGTTTLSGTTAVDVRSGAFFDVSGLTAGGNLTLNSSNLVVKGAGTITGSLTADTGNTIAPGDAGIGTLTVSNALTLNGGAGAALQMQLTSTPTTPARA